MRGAQDQRSQMLRELFHLSPDGDGMMQWVLKMEALVSFMSFDLPRDGLLSSCL